MLEIRWNIFLLVYILSVQLYDIQVEVPEKGWGNWNKCHFSPLSFTLGVVIYRHIARNKPKRCCCNVWMLSHFSCYFFFRKARKTFAISMALRGAGDRKPWYCVLKLFSFFGRHIFRIVGIRIPDAGAGSSKIRTTAGCQAPSVWLSEVWNPDKGVGFAKCREQSCRRTFCVLR